MFFFTCREYHTEYHKSGTRKKEILSEQCLWQLSWNQLFQIRTTAQKKDFSELLTPAQKKHVALNGTIARCQVANQQFNWFGDMRFETVIPRRVEEGLIKNMRSISSTRPISCMAEY